MMNPNLGFQNPDFLAWKPKSEIRICRIFRESGFNSHYHTSYYSTRAFTYLYCSTNANYVRIYAVSYRAFTL